MVAALIYLFKEEKQIIPQGATTESLSNTGPKIGIGLLLALVLLRIVYLIFCEEKDPKDPKNK